jgi:hypothetical protein
MAMIIRDGKSTETIVQLTKLCDEMLQYTSISYFPINDKICAILIDACLNSSDSRCEKWFHGFKMVQNT